MHVGLCFYGAHGLGEGPARQKCAGWMRCVYVCLYMSEVVCNGFSGEAALTRRDGVLMGREEVCPRPERANGISLASTGRSAMLGLLRAVGLRSTHHLFPRGLVSHLGDRGLFQGTASCALGYRVGPATW